MNQNKMYSLEEVKAFVEEEDVKFIRLAFCDIFGNMKNISIMSHELERAFEDGVSFDASAVEGFADADKSDLFLHPDSSTLTVLPWRPQSGRVVRMFCDIRHPDGTPYERDTRQFLRQAVETAKAQGISVSFGVEFEFYLFKTDEEGNSTKIPFDRAGYLDIAPEDKGENVRREICFSLLDMGILPESSHHEEGPGQQEIDFRHGDALTTADSAVTFEAVVKTIAMRNGLFADFSPKPLHDQSGSGMHINLSLDSGDKDLTFMFMAGILEHVAEITAFLNPVRESYERLGGNKAPKYITWSRENRSQLIRIPAAKENHKRIELRSPDAAANPYLAYALLIYAGLDGIQKKMQPQPSTDCNLFVAEEAVTKTLRQLPTSLDEALSLAENSTWLNQILPSEYIEQYRKHNR